MFQSREDSVRRETTMEEKQKSLMGVIYWERLNDSQVAPTSNTCVATQRDPEREGELRVSSATSQNYMGSCASPNCVFVCL